MCVFLVSSFVCPASSLVDNSCGPETISRGLVCHWNHKENRKAVRAAGGLPKLVCFGMENLSVSSLNRSCASVSRVSPRMDVQGGGSDASKTGQRAHSSSGLLLSESERPQYWRTCCGDQHAFLEPQISRIDEGLSF